MYEKKKVNEILEEYRKEMGFVGKHMEAMATQSPELLEAYTNLRSVILTKEGALARKIKELILLGIFAASKFEYGVEAHAKGALRAGATKREVFETVSLALLAAGVPAFIAGTRALELKES
jgi:AhpD family alkylhydroperoxidase